MKDLIEVVVFVGTLVGLFVLGKTHPALLVFLLLFVLVTFMAKSTKST